VTVAGVQEEKGGPGSVSAKSDQLSWTRLPATCDKTKVLPWTYPEAGIVVYDRAKRESDPKSGASEQEREGAYNKKGTGSEEKASV
jgi:hypothetical protein